MDRHSWQKYSGRRLSDVHLVLRRPRCAKKISTTLLQHHQQPEPSIKDTWIHAFMLVMANSDSTICPPQHFHGTTKLFSNLLLSNFVEPVWIKLQFRVLSSQELFCFCIPSASRNLLLTGYFLLFRPFSVNPRDRPSLWNTHGRPSATSNFYMFKLEVSLSLPHSDAQFELNQVVLTNPDQS